MVEVQVGRGPTWGAYSADDLLYFKVLWSKPDYSENGNPATPPFITYIDGIDINTYVANAMAYRNANVNHQITSGEPTVNLFLIRNRPDWPSAAPYTSGLVLQEINNWTSSNNNATIKGQGAGVGYPTLLYHRSGISPEIPENAISLFVFHADPVVTATGAALQFTPKLNINDLIA